MLSVQWLWSSARRSCDVGYLPRLRWLGNPASARRAEAQKGEAMTELKIAGGDNKIILIDLAMVSVMYGTGKRGEVCLYCAGRERPLIVRANLIILRKQVEHAKAQVSKPVIR
jgi:hypothetical protein